MNNKLTLLFFVIICLLASTAFADGTLIGVVSDSLSGFDLPGANIVISGTVFGASTDLNGEYRISNIPAGSYEVTISYIGYQTKNVNVDVADGETKVLSVLLYPEAIEGEVIVVTAQARGQQQAINQQLASDKIANIVSEQRIQELPDFNAAAALSRLPGISTTKSSGEDNKVVIRGLSPKYNSIEIEGVKLSATGSANMGLTSDVYVYTPGVSNDRSVDLTMVSPYMIRTIAVYKSLTPDMNANSIGGTVNMELREAPTGFRWDVLWQSGYTAKSNTYGNYRGVASVSNRFINEKLGVYALANLESYDRDADNLSAGYNQASTIVDSATGFRPMEVTSVTFNRHLETRDRYGANLILDYSLPNGSIKFVNMYARLNSDWTEHRQNINYNNGRMEWRFQQAENLIDQQLHSLKLDYNLGILTTDLSVSYTASHNDMDDSPVINFNQTDAVDREDRENKVPEELVHLQAAFDGDSAIVLRSGNMFSSDYQEDKLTFKADFEVPFSIGTAVSGSFKFGGQYHKQNNTNDQEAPYLGFEGGGGVEDPTNEDIQPRMIRTIRDYFGLYVNEGGDFTGNQFISNDKDLYDAFLKDKYGDVYYISDPKTLKSLMKYIIGNPTFDASDANYSSGRQGGWYDGPYQQLTNDYEYEENYYATYAMAKVNWFDFMLLGGARYEKVKSDYFAYNARDMRNAQLQRMWDTTSVSENEFVLPMGQIKYSPFDWMDVRYAYTQTLARPDYHQLTPKFTITQGNTIHSGNPSLKPARAFNHDLSFTFHANKLGLLTIGAFYKTVENFVYTPATGYMLDAAQNAGFDSLANYQVWRDGEAVVNPVNLQQTVYRPINNPNEAYIKGLEFDFQHNFWYMPRPLNNIVFGINYARISSKTTYPFYDRKAVGRPPVAVFIDSSFTGRLIDQPNHVLNSYLGYDYKGFSARLSVLYTDNSARANGGKYPENDSYTTEYLRIDFSARQRLPFFNSELFLDIANLNDEKTSWIQRSTGGFQGIENYGLTANIGIRIRY